MIQFKWSVYIKKSYKFQHGDHICTIGFIKTICNNFKLNLQNSFNLNYKFEVNNFLLKKLLQIWNISMHYEMS